VTPTKTERYTGPLTVGMIMTAPDNDGRLGFRRLRLLAEHPDGGWIVEDLPSRARRSSGSLARCPELNLRIVFVPEEKK
jgi:hypothetical protein